MKLILSAATFAALTAFVLANNNAFVKPEGGETWEAGQTVRISWINPAGAKVKLLLVTGESKNLQLAATVSSGYDNSAGSDGSVQVNWKLPETLSPGQYALEIVNNDNTDDVNYSNFFTIEGGSGKNTSASDSANATAPTANATASANSSVPSTNSTNTSVPVVSTESKNATGIPKTTSLNGTTGGNSSAANATGSSHSKHTSSTKVPGAAVGGGPKSSKSSKSSALPTASATQTSSSGGSSSAGSSSSSSSSNGAALATAGFAGLVGAAVMALL